ncbi:MAG: glycosyltransferase family 39 protein [Candidatus Brocadiia bacterium]|nr:glycosyltransferase family 39 protein [Candidatus Brocadiia bacterium]
MRTAVVIVCFAAVLAGAVRCWGISGKRTVGEAAAISYLCAAGNQTQWKEIKRGAPPFARWVEAREWKGLLRTERPFIFRTISRSLSSHDIHPPLYFWLLNVWAWLWGTGLWTGTSLNILVAMATTLLVFGLARTVLGDPFEASVVAFLWALSPIVVRVSFQARQYDLLALCTVAFVWQAVRYADASRRLRWWDHALLAASAAAGALTHYHFALVIASAVVYVFARLVRSDRRRLVAALCCIAGGSLLFAVLHPGFVESFRHIKRHNTAWSLEQFNFRLEKTARALAAFFVLGRKALAILTALLAALAVCAAVAWRRSGRTLRAYLQGVEWCGAAVLWFFGSIAGVVILLYLMAKSPKHAMGAKYLAAAWPFLAFVPVFLLRPCGPRARKALAIAWCGAMLLFGAMHAYYSVEALRGGPDRITHIRAARRIVIDHVHRSNLPQIIWHIPDDTLIYAASQKHMLEHPAEWLESLDGRCMFIGSLKYGNREDARAQLLGLLREEHEVTRVKGGVFGIGDIFLLEDAP